MRREIVCGAALLSAYAAWQWWHRRVSKTVPASALVSSFQSEDDAARIEALMKACAAGDTEAVMKACAAGDTEAVSNKLVQAKADINVVQGGITPLLCAAGEGHTSTVAWLVENKADVRSTARNGMTSVMGAATCGNKDIVAALGAAKANMHATDQNGVTALIYAAHGGHTEVVSYLVSAKADINVRSKAGVCGYKVSTVLVERNFPCSLYACMYACICKYLNVLGVAVLPAEVPNTRKRT